ncbi:MAG: DUF4097 family beta strand repeat protein [Phycisphaerales bacterium]|nr:DUF4097 family beta strand repeat protein [Phycisphaerales bacterium]
MSTFKTLAAIGLTASIFMSGCDTLSPRVYDYRVMKVDHLPSTPLSIITANGSIRALQEDRQDVAIEVELFGRNAERLSFAAVRADRQGDNTLRVWIEWPGGDRKNGEGAKIEVFIPGTDGVSAATSNGNVTLMGLEGDLAVDTSNGSIHIDQHNGPMNIHTSNGTIRVDDSTGDITFDTSNGRVLISNADSLVQGDTSNGNVYISTRNGTEGPIRVRTTNGRIELDLGHGFEGILRVSTTNGRIKTDGLENANLIESSKHSLELQLGDSDTISAVRTSNGSVRIHGRSDN